MPVLRSRWGTPGLMVVSLAFIALVIAVVWGLGILPATGSTTRISLEGVSAAELKDRNIELYVASEDDFFTISKAEAESKGRESASAVAGEDVRVKEVTPARLVIKNLEPPIDQLVWVVNFDPDSLHFEPIGGGPIDGGPTPDTPLVPAFAISFIDAKTGELLYYISSATQDGPPPEDKPLDEN